MKISFAFFLILFFKILCVVQNKIYSQEKEVLLHLNNLVSENLNLIEKLDKKNQDRESLKNLMEKNKKCFSRSDQQESCSTLINLSNNEKNLTIFNTFNLPFNHDETLLNFNFLNLNKLNLNFERKQGKIDKKEEYFLIIMFTDKNIIIVNNQGKILTTYALNFNIKIEKADFSSFDEDNTVVILTDKLELSIFTIDIKLEGNAYDELKVEVFIPTRKSITLNFNNDVVSFLKQHRLHGNKYIVLSFENGNILVMNKDLEMKNSILMQKKINNLFLSNGFLTVISHNEFIFLNVLGGNAVLLKCTNYYDILHLDYDTANNFIFMIDDNLNFVIYNIKLTISKQNSNECNPMFTLKLPKIIKKYLGNIDKNNVKMELVRNILYIIAGTDYVAVIDFNLINDNGLLFNEFMIKNYENSENSKNSKKLEITQEKSTNLIYSFLTYPNLNHSSNFILLKNPNSQNFLLLQLKNVNSEKKFIKNMNTSPSSIPSQPKDNTNPIINFLFNNSILKAMNNNIFSVYLVVIAVLSIIIIYYKNKKRTEEDANKSMKKTKYSEDDEKMLEEMMKSIGGGLLDKNKGKKDGKIDAFKQNLQNLSKSKFENTNKSSMNKNSQIFDDLDDEDYEEYEEEDEEDIDEEEIKQPKE